VVSVAARETDTAAKEDMVVAREDMAAEREDLVVAAGGEGVEGNREARPDPVLPVNLVLV
jgi:diacylglycerol kinase family enzyme